LTDETQGSALIERKEEALAKPSRDERDSHLAEETAAGLRLHRVALEDGALIMQGSNEAQRRVTDAFGCQSREFQTYCLAQLLAILPEASQGDDYTLPINAAVEMLAAIGPRDALEAMLAVQMIASNHMAMLSMRRTKGASTVDVRQMNGNLATKFSRTFAAQLEALNRHRRGGKQIVEHVHINAGGQAVIAGTVNTGRGGGE